MASSIFSVIYSFTVKYYILLVYFLQEKIEGKQTALVNWMQKVLEEANIRLASVATDILGKSSRGMIEAIINGEEDPVILSELAQRRLKNKKEELKRALKGLIGPHQRLTLKGAA